MNITLEKTEEGKFQINVVDARNARFEDEVDLSDYDVSSHTNMFTRVLRIVVSEDQVVGAMNTILSGVDVLPQSKFKDSPNGTEIDSVTGLKKQQA